MNIYKELDINLELRLEDKFGKYRKQTIELSNQSYKSLTIKKVLNITKNIFEKSNENNGYISYESFICKDISEIDINIINMHTILILTRNDGNFYINDIELKECSIMSFKDIKEIKLKFKGNGVYNYIIVSVS